MYATCDAIWQILGPLVLAPPDRKRWAEAEDQFRSRWNYPNCVGTIDGKHIVINKPAHSGTLYFNYKGFCSVVLLAVVDANYKFLVIDVGAQGKNSDGGIFSHSVFGKRFHARRLDFPPDKPLPGTQEPLPHVLVGDEAFPLDRHLMRPYPGNELTHHEDKKVYNYRHSRARNTCEDAFGILSKRFRLYQRRLEIKPKHVCKVVLATCCLHNFLRDDSDATLSEIMESEEITRNSEHGMQDLRNIGGSFSYNAHQVRGAFKDFFNSPAGSVEWQTRMVQRGKRYNPTNQE